MLHGGGTRARGVLRALAGTLLPAPTERWARVPPCHRSGLVHHLAPCSRQPDREHIRCDVATLVPLLLFSTYGDKEGAACPLPPGPAGAGQGSPGVVGMLTQGSAKPRGGGQRIEEKTSGKREGGGMQEEMRTHCQLGSCVCCLEAAANHSLQLK